MNIEVRERDDMPAVVIDGLARGGSQEIQALKLERRKDAVESWGRKVEKALSGRQSIMNGLKAEQSAPASQFSGQTYGRRAA